ncbi:MAG: multicopper oxidase domain-containing protein [Rhizomicrobium sp.]
MAIIRFTVLAFLLALLIPQAAFAQSTGPCPRPGAGVPATPAPDLYSVNGVLSVALNYETGLDEQNRTLFCFVTPTGQEAPTLHVNPGDTISISLTDMVQFVNIGPSEVISNSSNVCGASTMNSASTNIHFHGTNTAPTCGSDEVIHTLVNTGQTFQYTLQIPADEPPGLYWYHTHVHGIASPTVQGGATGLIEVEGIANIEPTVAGLPERFLSVRDQPVTAMPVQGEVVPYWDLSLNYVPVSYPAYTPALIQMQRGTKELWRVANSASNTILDLQLQYDGKVQPLQLVALDGVPIGSQDGSGLGMTLKKTDIYLPPAGRAEFIVTAPGNTVKTATLSTLGIDTGPAGDVDPPRPLATIETIKGSAGLPIVQARNGRPHQQRFKDLVAAAPTATRSLYLTEKVVNGPPPRKASRPGAYFYITVDGQTPTVFNPNNPPAIVTTQGAVEDWTIENRTAEVHAFHIHQIHFLLMKVNGKRVPVSQQQYYDTYPIGYWTGTGPYPSITVRMDFRGPVVGDFVYHCHILDHEDGGMMAIVQVNPQP